MFEAVSHPAKSCHAKLLAVKNVVIMAMIREAKAQLRIKVAREGWSGGISLQWVEVVAGLKKTWCNPISSRGTPFSGVRSTKMTMYGSQ